MKLILALVFVTRVRGERFMPAGVTYLGWGNDECEPDGAAPSFSAGRHQSGGHFVAGATWDGYEVLKACDGQCQKADSNHRTRVNESKHKQMFAYARRPRAGVKSAPIKPPYAAGPASWLCLPRPCPPWPPPVSSWLSWRAAPPSGRSPCRRRAPVLRRK